MVTGEETHSVRFGVTVDLHHVNGQILLVQKLFRTRGALEKHVAVSHIFLFYLKSQVSDLMR